MYEEDRRYYDLLYRFVKGYLRWEEIEDEYREAVYQMKISFLRRVESRLIIAVILLIICAEMRRLKGRAD